MATFKNSKCIQTYFLTFSHQVGPCSSHISWICPQTLPETNCETCAVRGPTLWPRLPSNNFWSAVHFGTSDASFPQLPETPFVSVSLILLITKTYKSPMLWPHGKGLLLWAHLQSAPWHGANQVVTSSSPFFLTLLTSYPLLLFILWKCSLEILGSKKKEQTYK